MDYAQYFADQAQIAAYNLQIANHRRNLYAICQMLEIGSSAAFRIAQGTFFGPNPYEARGFNLTDEDCQALNAEYDAIARLEIKIANIHCGFDR